MNVGLSMREEAKFSQPRGSFAPFLNASLFAAWKPHDVGIGSMPEEKDVLRHAAFAKLKG